MEEHRDPDWMLPIRRAVDEQIRAEVVEHGQMTLGTFIAELEKLPCENLIVYDLLAIRPTDLDSYRGYYDHLALGYTDDVRPTVGEILDKAKAAMGRTFMGYKGGDFVMNEHTPLWVSNHGHSGGLRIVGVDTWKDTNGKLSNWTTIKTAREDE